MKKVFADMRELFFSLVRVLQNDWKTVSQALTQSKKDQIGFNFVMDH